MAITRTDIQKLYVIFFNRPGDVDGLAFWTAQDDFRSVAVAMTRSPEYVALHAGMSNTAIVTDFYQNIFERLPDAEGLAFWVDALDRGALDQAGLAVMLASVAQGKDGTVQAHKATLADSFTTALNTPARKEIFELNLGARIVKTLVDSVGVEAGSLQIAQLNVVPTINALFPVAPGTPAASVPGASSPAVQPAVPPSSNTSSRVGRQVSTDPAQAFVLTVNNDNLSGGTGDDTFTGLIAGAGLRTYDPGDVLDGGAGTDSLSLSIDRDASIAGAAVRNIERLSVSASASAVVTFDGAAGITELINDSSTGNLQFGTQAGGLAALVNLIIKGGTGNTALAYLPSALAGNADAMTVSMTGNSAALSTLSVGSTDASTNQLESLSLDISGSHAIRLQTNPAQSSLSTLQLRGSGALALQFAADGIQTSLDTIDATQATGDLTLGSNIDGLAAAVRTIRLGAGNDTIFMGTNIGASHRLDGGAGLDTLAVRKALSAGDLAQVSDIEVIRFEGSGRLTQDARFADLHGVNFESSGLDSLTLLGLATRTTVSIRGMTSELHQTLANDGTDDSLTLGMTGRGSLFSLYDVNGLDQLNIVSTGRTNLIGSDLVRARHVITGDQDLSIRTSLLAQELDASAFTGNLNIRSHATAASLLIGGTGNDTLSAGAGDDTIWLGAQGSNRASGADRISTGNGKDSIVFVGNRAGGDGAASTYSGFAEIFDFHVGSVGATDQLRFSANDADFMLAGKGLAKGPIRAGLAAGDAMVMQVVSGGPGTVSASAGVSFFKLSKDLVYPSTVSNLFYQAMDRSSITGLAADGNYLISAYDTTHARMVLALVSPGTSGAGNTTLSRADMNDAGIVVLGVLDMNMNDYANFDGAQLGTAV